MGAKTRAELMDEAGVLAGNDTTPDDVRNWLDNWLQRTAKSWPWPVLKARVTDLAIASGVSSVQLGYGTSMQVDGVTNAVCWVHRIMGGYVYYRNSTYKSRGRILIRALLAGNPDKDFDVRQAGDRLGTPTTAQLRKFKDGSMKLYLDPVPNEALYLSFDVHQIPNAIGGDSTTDSQVPWYPNDRTLIHALKCAYMELDDGGEGTKGLDLAFEKLGQMVVDDRDFDGSSDGDNEALELDKSVFA